MLVAVLCLIALLTMLALGATEATRRHGQLAQRSFESVQTQELADSAIRLALLELSLPSAVQTDGAGAIVRRTIEVFGRPVALTFQLEAGRIDLNAADEFLLTAAFAGNGLPRNEAEAMAMRIIDWRDADDAVGRGGAERDEYRRAGRTGAPRNGPFETVSELQQVLGAQSIADDLLDAFTVYTHSPDVRRSSSPATVMNALRWADANHLAGRTWIDSDSSPVAGFPESTDLGGEVVRFEACAKQARASTCRLAIVRLTGRSDRPAMSYVWRTRYEGSIVSR